MTNDKPRFEVGFQGESEYSWRGRRYRVRSSAADWIPNYWNYTPEEYAAQYVALVGAILGPDMFTFPPAELVAHFPGYVGAKFNPVNWTVEYDGPTPATVHSPIYGTLSGPWAAEFTRNGWPLAKAV